VGAIAVPHVLPVTVYYEDTDFTGMVYHPNYLKYFERAREEILGVERLAELWSTKGYGFVVYKVEMRFKEPAVHGDRLEIRTVVRAESEYRMVFDQTVWRTPSSPQPAVSGVVEMVTVDKGGRLVPIPEDILAWIRTSGG
jgi:tol-pal system-associated acyl-CoA thioesterase